MLKKENLGGANQAGFPALLTLRKKDRCCKSWQMPRHDELWKNGSLSGGPPRTAPNAVRIDLVIQRAFAGLQQLGNFPTRLSADLQRPSQQFSIDLPHQFREWQFVPQHDDP